MKGILLAGGTGSRLSPLTNVCCKQLLPVYSKPMIFYSLSVLMLSGIRDILIICRKQDERQFRSLLLDGNQWGIEISYGIQDAPNGIAEAFLIGEQFIGNESVTLILGDNIFFSHDLSSIITPAEPGFSGCRISAYRVNDPSRYGVVSLGPDGSALEIEEKPASPQSNLAVTGLYTYDNDVVYRAKTIVPSARKELEITSVNKSYLDDNKLTVNVLGRGVAWFDAGTYESLFEATNFVRSIEKRQGFKIGCPEEIAFNFGWIGSEGIMKCSNLYLNGEYRDYLIGLVS